MECWTHSHRAFEPGIEARINMSVDHPIAALLAGVA
jgi:hypothetical protein